MSIDTRHRQPKGIPVGGQFAATTHAEPGIVLAAERHREVMAARHDLFRAANFVPATTMSAMNSPATAEHREEWWNRNFVAAEYGVKGKNYPQMPDDFTPAQTPGHAMSGKRRTHRMNYGNKDISLRMPSATSIKRFSGENGNPTFDVPVSVSVKGGAPVQGWVRVTKTGPHSWDTTTLGGNGGDASEQVAEAVAAILESRRVSVALAKIPDLLAARKNREAAKGAELKPVNSSFINAVGFDPNTSTMATRIGNKLYGHQVTRQFFEAVQTAEHPGAVFNKLVRAHQPAGVVQCGKCARFSSTRVPHTCPSGHKAASGLGMDHVVRARRRAESVASSRSGSLPAPAREAAVTAARPVAPVNASGLVEVDGVTAAPLVAGKKKAPAPRRPALDPEFDPDQF